MKSVKVTIVGGGGGVGSSTAFNLLAGDAALEVVLVDSKPEMVASHVMDLEQVRELSPTGAVRGGDAGDMDDSDVVVVTASVPLRLNSSRADFLADNAAVLQDVADLLAQDWPGVLVVVTNPVDPLVLLLQRRTGIERRRVLGYTLNDSLRLRTGIGKALGAAPGSVDAWVIGEHGDGCVPLFDRVRVDGKAVSLTGEQRAAAEEFLRTWYFRHVALDSSRTSTWTSGVGVARMVSAIAVGASELWAASVVLDGEYGLDHVALGVPVTLGRGGAKAIHEWTLTAEDRAALAAGAVNVRRSFAIVAGGKERANA